MDKKWNKNFEEAKIFINLNNRRPRSKQNKCKNVPENEKYLGGWLQSQGYNYKKEIKSMKLDSENRNVWEKFIADEKYKKYFK